MVRPLAVGKKYHGSRLRGLTPPAGFFKLGHSGWAIVVQITAQEPPGGLQAESLDKYLRHIHGAPGLALEVLTGMLPVVSCKACIVFIPGIGRKFLQILVALLFQIAIPG